MERTRVPRRLIRDGTDPGTALVIIDVDRFKEINDTYGHAIGDDTLAHIAAILSSRCRGVDIVARLGGDELAVLIPACDYGTAQNRATDFVDAARNSPLKLPDLRAITLSISAGAAHAPSQARTARDLYSSADGALYAAKRRQRRDAGRVA